MDTAILLKNFNEASEKVQGLNYRPSNEDLLMLYALYKQVTEGDVSGVRPGGFDFKGAAKYDAWKSIKGMEKEEAMHEYIKLAEQLLAAQKA
ncbi:MAG: acyl-CoA-binding protein [Cyclobacteriaceae bacterium]|nr:acyl-CoA-binding protein [Cyclobacteriaceae bacterium]